MPTARPIIEIGFGTKKLKRQTCPSRRDQPEGATPIAKMPMMIGVTPAIARPEDDQQHDDRDDDADRLALLRSSSEIFLKSSVEVGSPSMYIVVSPVV